jgi:hypothetical protein
MQHVHRFPRRPRDEDWTNDRAEKRADPIALRILAESVAERARDRRGVIVHREFVVLA